MWVTVTEFEATPTDEFRLVSDFTLISKTEEPTWEPEETHITATAIYNT